MDATTAPSYRRVRRGLIRLVGGPGHTNRLYGNPGYVRVLREARRGALDPALASVIAADELRCTPWPAAAPWPVAPVPDAEVGPVADAA